MPFGGRRCHDRDAAAFGKPVAVTAEYQRDTFKIIPLIDVYYSEGANVGDIDGDGVTDAVYGPYWFKGPNFTARQEIFAAKPQPVEGYANHFFCWVYDFNGDEHPDILTAGFPGTPAFVYENPGPAGLDKHWTRHKILDSICNESPQWLNLVGDERPELVCTHDGYFGYATIDWSQPFSEWQFHNVSERNAPKPFGHGLGVGDIDGDGRQDIITKDGWFAQPAAPQSSSMWDFHPVAFAGPGGAEMYAYDVDGDGDSDVITSVAAHEFGLAWYEQRRQGDRVEFVPHTILGSEPSENRYGLLFSELHSVNLADIDGDGLKDIVDRQDVLFAPQAKPAVGRRRGGLLVQADAATRMASIGFPIAPPTTRASAGNSRSPT